MTIVSVVIPAFNAEDFLAEAIESVFANECTDLEVIVVDDGSSDRSAEIARRYPVHLIVQANQGVSAARNVGYRAAHGEYFAGLDADDRWCAGKLEHQLQCLITDPSLDVVYGSVQQFRESPRYEALGDPVPGRLPGTMLARRRAFEKVGAFDESLVLGEFMDFIVRSREAGLKELVLEQVCLQRRIHGANLGVTARDHISDYFEVARRSLAAARRRKN